MLINMVLLCQILLLMELLLYVLFQVYLCLIVRTKWTNGWILFTLLISLEPKFVDIYERGDYFYFFMREEAEESNSDSQV